MDEIFIYIGLTLLCSALIVCLNYIFIHWDDIFAFYTLKNFNLKQIEKSTDKAKFKNTKDFIKKSKKIIIKKSKEGMTSATIPLLDWSIYSDVEYYFQNKGFEIKKWNDHFVYISWNF